MRPPIYVATLLLAVGCAQPPLVQTAPLPSDQPLAVRLHQPIGGTLHYSLSEPAYVAIFAISRGYGIGLVFPHYEGQVDRRSHAGLNQEIVHGGRGAWSYSTLSRYEWTTIFGNPDAYYIIASRSPLPVEAIIQSPHVLRHLLGERTFRANNFAEAWNALEELLVADLPHDHWAADAFVTWRDPFLSVAYSEPPRFLQYCADGTSYLVASLLEAGRCYSSRRERSSTPVIPVVELPRRNPPKKPFDRDPSVPLPPDIAIRASRGASEGLHRERDRTGTVSRQGDVGRESARRSAESARPPVRDAGPARQHAPAPPPSRPAESRPQAQPSRPDGNSPAPKPDN